MEQFLQYHRRIFLVMAAVCLAVLAALWLGLRGDASWALGFACGAAAQLLKFGFIDVSVVRRLAAGGKGAETAQLKASLFSLLILGIAVAAVYKLGGNVWGMAAGIFLPRVILVADSWLRPNPFGGTGAGK